ncbi:putative aminoacyltransferase, E1 ubiquitin-activating enzyme [Rosa chinensis]|uniref:RING-type E3 ubiquitin transferase n=1 Tax=Rosa chinensis TaxID=74649 RepID=A0A2P6QSV9_ROSCH|nr:putative aminoacyltransferase, E1 ubiquitin-activating enzyme [Rosa chinensis]
MRHDSLEEETRTCVGVGVGEGEGGGGDGDGEDDEDDVDDNDDMVETSPANESAIEELEEMRDDSLEEETRTCVICLEEVAGKATRLPCLQLFHEACIEEWLKIKHMCPLCRYPIPCNANQGSL